MYENLKKRSLHSRLSFLYASTVNILQIFAVFIKDTVEIADIYIQVEVTAIPVCIY